MSMRALNDLFSRKITYSFLFLGTCLCGKPGFTEQFVDEEEAFDEEEFIDSPLISMNESTTAAPSQKPEVFPAPTPHFSHPWAAVVRGDFLYWRAKEEGLSYALPSPNFGFYAPFPQSNFTKGVNGKIARVNPGYEPGFRLSVDFFVPRDHWDVEFCWTSYWNQHSSSRTARPPEVLFTFWLNNNFDPIAQQAKAHWKLAFNRFDLTLGRSFCPGKFLVLHPFAGFEAAWIEQNLNIDYQTITFNTGTTTPFLKSRNKSNTQNYGMTAGLDTDWKLGYGFSIQANCQGSLLWTDFHLLQKEIETGPMIRTRLKDHFHQITAVINLFGGVSWATQFQSDRYYLEFHTGWEEQVWFDQNQFNRFLSNSDVSVTTNLQGDLSFSGWTIGAKFGF